MKRHDVSKVYILRAELDGVEPLVWRRLEVPGTYSLRQLHSVLQEAFAWWDSHLHEFQLTDAIYGMSEIEDAPEDQADDRRIKLQDAVGAGGHMTYAYDFGDSWEVRIRVEAVSAADPLATYPRCTGGQRAAPPEDCGGVGGYEELLDALERGRDDPENDDPDPEDEDRRQWIGGFWDPEGFDANAVNRRLHGPGSPRYRWPGLSSRRR